MATNLLSNGGFEAEWDEEGGHRCLILPEGGAPHEASVGNIFTPPGWWVWFYHQPGTWDQPEVRDAWAAHDPRRVHEGQKGMLLFTFYRRHDAGFLQQVQVTPGTRLRLSAWAHAWSNLHGGAHEDDPKWSEGPGYDAGFLLEGEPPPADSPGTLDDWRNFTFSVGIDPAGGRDPLADTVVWGRGAHIYNRHAQVPPVEAVAQSETVTIFLRSRTLWPFKHNDAYWDDVRLTRVTVPVEATIAVEPAQPQAGAAMEIRVRSQVTFTGAQLTVTDPEGASTVLADPEIDSVDGEHVWRWSFTPQRAGVYHARFTANEGAATPAELSFTVLAPPPPRTAHLLFELERPRAGDPISVLALSVHDFDGVELQVTGPDEVPVAVTPGAPELVEGQHTWRWTFTPQAAGAYRVRFVAQDGTLVPAETTFVVLPEIVCEGVPPRIPYARVYVLIPPGAGVEWVRAILDSGRWEEKRWTIGGSADDAGVGPQDRTVLAVNPDRWPGDLQDFFEQYYPGAVFIPIEADTPAQLAQKLQDVDV
jgi:hypothetical protein